MRTNGGDGEIAVDNAPVIHDDALNAAVAFESACTLAGMDIHAVVLQIAGEEFSGAFSGEAMPGVFRAHDQIDGKAEIGERAAKFNAQQATADDGDAASPAIVHAAAGFGDVDGVTEPFHVAQRSQIEINWAALLRTCEPVGRIAGCQQQFVVGNLAAVIQGDGAASRIEIGDATSGSKVDALLGKPVWRQREEILAPRLAPKVILAQRRPVVGAIDFLADDEKRSGGVDFANCDGSRATGDVSAHQQRYFTWRWSITCSSIYINTDLRTSLFVSILMQKLREWLKNSSQSPVLSMSNA